MQTSSNQVIFYLVNLITLLFLASCGGGTSGPLDGANSGSDTTVKGILSDQALSGSKIYAIGVNSPGEVLAEGNVGDDGSFSIQITKESKNTYIVIVPKVGAVIVIEFNVDGAATDRLHVGKGKVEIDLETIIVIAGKAKATLKGNAKGLASTDDVDDENRDEFRKTLVAKLKGRPDGIGCAVWATQPREGAIVEPGKPIKIWFTNPIDKDSLSNITFEPAGVTALGVAKFAQQDAQVMFHPKNLANGDHVLTIPTSVKCASGDALAAELTLTFTVKKGTVENPPVKELKVLGVIPENETTVEAGDIKIAIAFNQAISDLSIGAGSGLFALEKITNDDEETIEINVGRDPNDEKLILISAKSPPLAEGEYKITVGTNITSKVGGVNLDEEFTSTFTVTAAKRKR